VGSVIFYSGVWEVMDSGMEQPNELSETAMEAAWRPWTVVGHPRRHQGIALERLGDPDARADGMTVADRLSRWAGGRSASSTAL